jgi:hypothetical protein
MQQFVASKPVLCLALEGTNIFPLQPCNPPQAEIKWKRTGNKTETHFRFISSSKRFEKSLGIVSRIGMGPIRDFPSGHCGYPDQPAFRSTRGMKNSQELT